MDLRMKSGTRLPLAVLMAGSLAACGSAAGSQFVGRWAPIDGGPLMQVIPIEGSSLFTVLRLAKSNGNTCVDGSAGARIDGTALLIDGGRTLTVNPATKLATDSNGRRYNHVDLSAEMPHKCGLAQY